MKNLTIILTVCLSLLFLSACHERSFLRLTDPNDKILFKFKRVNSSDTFISQSKSTSVKSRSSRWSTLRDGGIRLVRELVFEVELKNGNSIDVEFFFSKIEMNTDILILEEEDKSGTGRRWDYISFEEEVSNFYDNYDKGVLSVGGKVKRFDSQSQTFNILRTKKAFVDGIEKTYLSAYFAGKTYGLYDCCERKEFNEIIDGFFEGVIE